MFEKTLSTALKFSIIGSSSESIDIIKKAFAEIPVRIVLHETYRSVKAYTAGSNTAEAVDFIAIDQYIFSELEEKEQAITQPLIVFANDIKEIKSVHNIVFDSIKYYSNK
ncbi:MAG: hypothetical protein WDM90_01985 [Ferruginibacter sp.]